jgi:hypothetical protein
MSEPELPGFQRKQVNMKFTLGRRQLATIGLVVGAAIGGVGIANAATSATTPTDPAVTTPADPAAPAAPAAGTGVDQSNNDPTHEATESADREANETAGKMGGGGNHHSNTDAAHEASESPERAAQEAANDAALGTAATTPASTTGG